MKKGFTLVELVIVIIIVGILSLVAVPIYRNYVLKAKLTEAEVLAGSIVDKVNLYILEKGYPYFIWGDLFPGSQYAVAGGLYDSVYDVDIRNNKYIRNVAWFDYNSEQFYVEVHLPAGEKYDWIDYKYAIDENDGSINKGARKIDIHSAVGGYFKKNVDSVFYLF